MHTSKLTTNEPGPGATYRFMNDCCNNARSTYRILRLLLLLTGSAVAGGCVQNETGTGRSEPDLAESISRVRFAADGSMPAFPMYSTGEEAGLFSILESLGGGVGVIDIDSDGWSDLCFPGGGRLSATKVAGAPTTLLRSRNGRFEDVSGEAGVCSSSIYTHGCCVGDFNNDGFSDLLVTGYGGITLLRNESDGTFTDITAEAGLADPDWSSSAGWGDLNDDGVLDLYVAHYVNWSLSNNPECMGPENQRDVCPPRAFDGVTDAVFINRNDGTFENATDRLSLAPQGKGLGVLISDFNDDMYTDIYVANDTTSNFLYQSRQDGSLEESGLITGAALDDFANPNGSMGVEVADIDNDGLPDVWVTNYEDEVIALYRNSGAGNFVHESATRGLKAVGQVFVGFGCAAEDWDLDGDEDFLVSNGHVVRFPRNAPVDQQALLLENSEGRFTRVIGAGDYFSKSWSGRGLAVLDANQDGLPDVAISHIRHPPELLINQSKPKGRSLRLRLFGNLPGTNRDAAGAKISVGTPGRPTQHRWNNGGGSYLSASEKTQTFAVPGQDSDAEIEVRWPGGRISSATIRIPGDASAAAYGILINESKTQQGTVVDTLRCVRIPN